MKVCVANFKQLKYIVLQMKYIILQMLGSELIIWHLLKR